jgi:hypothetical protein
MGFAPPDDAPPPDEQAAVEAEAGFAPSPTGASLCGFVGPVFTLSLSFKLPALPTISLPVFDFMITPNCDLSNPIDADFSFGGGRVGQTDPDADDDVKKT